MAIDVAQLQALYPSSPSDRPRPNSMTAISYGRRRPSASMQPHRPMRGCWATLLTKASYLQGEFYRMFQCSSKEICRCHGHGRKPQGRRLKIPARRHGYARAAARLSGRAPVGGHTFRRGREHLPSPGPAFARGERSSIP